MYNVGLFGPIELAPTSAFCLLKREEFEDTKRVFRIRISKKNRQHNGKRKRAQKDKQRSTKHAYTTKDRVTRTPLKTGGESR